MSNTDKFLKRGQGTKRKEFFQNYKDSLANMANKNSVIAGYEARIRQLKAELLAETTKNGEETSRAWKLMETINDLKQSVKLETERMKELNGNRGKKGK